MNIVLLVLAICCFLYFLILMVGASISSAFVWFWAVMALMFSFFAWLWKHYIFPPFLRYLFFVLSLFLVVLFVIVEGVILRHCFDQGSEDLDYLVVLGAQVRGTTVSRSLKMRLDKALVYLEENPDTKVIVSGGQGNGEDVTEAFAMAEYLEGHGIARERIIMEENSTNTEENLIFSMALMEKENPRVGIVTNNFHVFRAVQIGKKLGVGEVEGIAASSEGFLQVNYLVREFFAVIKYFISGNI